MDLQLGLCSAHARIAILRAARELVDRLGFRRVTIEGIAQRAGVGKATIYRWWPSKAAVVMDAFCKRPVLASRFLTLAAPARTCAVRSRR